MLNSRQQKNLFLNRNTLICFSVLVAVGVISCFLLPIVNIGLIAGILLMTIIFSRPFRYPPVLPLFIIILYGNLLKYLTGNRYVLMGIDLFILLLFLKIYIEACIKRKLPIYSLIIESSLLIFLGISLLQLFNPNVPVFTAGLEGFRKTSFYMIGVFIGLHYIRTTEQFQKAIKIFTWFSLPIILYGIKQAFHMSLFDQRMVDLNWSNIWTYTIYGWNRPIGLFSGPFHYAMLCILIVLCFIYLFLETQKRYYIFLIPLPVMGSLLAMSRTNLVALVGSVVVFMFLYLAYGKGYSKKKLFKYSAMFILLVAIVIVISASNLKPLSRSITSLVALKEDRRFLNRIEGWQGIIQAVQKQPIRGYGMGSAGDTLQYIYDFPLHYTSHNLALKILMETGIPGLFFYCVFFFGWLGIAYRALHFREIRIQNLSALSISMVGVILINGMVGSAIEAFPISFIIWFFMGAFIRIYSTSQDRAGTGI